MVALQVTSKFSYRGEELSVLVGKWEGVCVG